MKLWLQQLHEKNEQYCTLFPNGRKKFFKDHGVVIPIPFRPRSMIDLYQKFHRLQWTLKESHKLTGMELLRLVIPELGIRYEEAFHQHKRPLDRFFSLTSTQYSTAIAGRYQTLVNSRKMLKSMQITEQVAYDPLSEQGPASALHELDSIEQERRWEGARLKQVRDALQAGDTAPFLKLDLDLSKEKVINGLPGLFEGIDFQAMTKRGSPDLEKQKKVFSALLTGSYRTLCLKGCAVLNSTTWGRLIKASPQALILMTPSFSIWNKLPSSIACDWSICRNSHALVFPTRLCAV